MTTASSSSRQAHADAVASQLGTRLCSGTFTRRSGSSDGPRPGSVTLLSSRPAAPREICSFTAVPRAIRSSSPAPLSLMPARLPLSARCTPVSPGLVSARPARRSLPRHDSIRPTTLNCMRDYSERLYVPVAWWLLAVPIVLVLGGTLYAGLPWPWPIVIIGGLAVGSAALLIAFGRGTVEVGDGVLRTGDDVLPLAVISEVAALDERQTARLRGPRADPAARLYSRPYLKESVYLAVEPGASAGGRVPYWLIGSRHPTELAAVLERCRIRGGHEPVA